MGTWSVVMCSLGARRPKVRVVVGVMGQRSQDKIGAGLGVAVADLVHNIILSRSQARLKQETRSAVRPLRK